MLLVPWSYAAGWDLTGLGSMKSWAVDKERILIHDERHTQIYQICLANLGIEGVRLMPYPARMTARKSVEVSRELIRKFAQSRGVDGEFINIEHELPSLLGLESCGVRDGLVVAVHRRDPYLSPPANLVAALKTNLRKTLSFNKAPLICVGAHGKSMSLKAVSPEAQVAIGQQESYSLTVFAQAINQAALAAGLSACFVSVDYRKADDIQAEIEATQLLWPNVKMLRAEIDHDKGDLVWIPTYYEALRQIANEAGGTCVVLTNRSNATHYAGLLCPRIPLVILGPPGYAEWDQHANSLNGGLAEGVKMVHNISADTEASLVTEAAAVLERFIQ